MYVHVRASPGAKKESVTKVSEAEFQIHVREPAERNMANRRIIELLAEHLNTKAEQVKMLTGHRSSSKMFSVELE
jgi:uncharacterized protein